MGASFTAGSMGSEWVIGGRFAHCNATPHAAASSGASTCFFAEQRLGFLFLSFINRQRAWEFRLHSYSCHSFSLQSLIPTTVTHFYSTTRSNIATCIIQRLVLYNNLYHTTTGAYTPTSSHTTTCTLPIQQLVPTQVDPQEWTGLIISSE